MPKLIIPNVHELYKSPDSEITAEFANSRYAYDLRFLWLMQAGDAIILPGAPAPGFLNYMTEILQIDLRSLNIVLWEDPMDAEFEAAISNPKLVKKLRQQMSGATDWTIQTCYFNKALKQLAESLDIAIDPQYMALINTDGIPLLNSKSEFRRIALQNRIPIPKGITVHSADELSIAIKMLMAISDQLIVKQDLEGGGRGNTIVSAKADASYCGAKDEVVLTDDIDSIAEHFFQDNKSDLALVVESYCQNSGTFTANIFIPPNGGKPQLLQYSQIRMDKIWIGVEIPAQILSPDEIEQLINYSLRLADQVQSAGYSGFICCDAILTKEGFLFTEINVRPGAETHSHFLASHLFGIGYLSETVVLTRRGLRVDQPLKTFLDILDSKGLLLKPGEKSGVAILTFDDELTKDAEIFVCAANYEQAQSIEKQAVSEMRKLTGQSLPYDEIAPAAVPSPSGRFIAS